jgi:hypothetical protein
MKNQGNITPPKIHKPPITKSKDIKMDQMPKNSKSSFIKGQ